MDRYRKQPAIIALRRGYKNMTSQSNLLWQDLFEVSVSLVSQAITLALTITIILDYTSTSDLVLTTSPVHALTLF